MERNGDITNSKNSQPHLSLINNKFDEENRQVENVTSNITNKAKEIGAEVEKQAEYAGQYLSSKASAVAQSIKDHVPTRSDIESAASNVVNKIERGGRYVADRDLDELAQDFTVLIRKNPALSVAAGIGLGFLLGTTLKSK